MAETAEVQGLFGKKAYKPLDGKGRDFYNRIAFAPYGDVSKWS